MKYIYSTMSADNKIAIYEKNAENKQVAKASVTIFGKANIANPKTLLTPKGMLTMLDEKEYELIKEDYSFKKWIDRGFIKVESKKAEADEVASKDMTKKDKSAQKTAKDYGKLDAKVVE